MAFDAQGLLGNPMFMMGMGGLAANGRPSGMMQGLLGYNRYQQQQDQNKFRQMQMEQMKAQIQQANEASKRRELYRQSFGNPAVPAVYENMMGMEGPAQMVSAETPGSGMFSADPAEQSKAALASARWSDDPMQAMLMQSQIAKNLRKPAGPLGSPDIQGFTQAVNQGYKGDWMQYLKDTQPPSAQTIIDMRSKELPTREQIMREDLISRAGEARKLHSKYLSVGRDARGQIERMHKMIDLNDQVRTGTGADLVLSVNKLGKFLGMDINLSNDEIAKAEELQSQLGDEVMERVGQTKGAVSEKEMELFQKYSANFGNTPEGNKRILEFKKMKAERDLAISGMIRNMRREGKTSLEIDDEIEDYLDKNSLIHLFDPETSLGVAPGATDWQNAAQKEILRRQRGQ